MRKIGMGLTALLLVTTLGLASASPSSAAPPSGPTRIDGGGFVLETDYYTPSNLLFAKPTLRMSAKVSYLGPSGDYVPLPSGQATVVFHVGTNVICQATNSYAGVASCALPVNLGTVLAVLAGKAQASFAGTALLGPSEGTVTLIGPALVPPPGPL